MAPFSHHPVPLPRSQPFVIDEDDDYQSPTLAQHHVSIPTSHQGQGRESIESMDSDGIEKGLNRDIFEKDGRFVDEEKMSGGVGLGEEEDEGFLYGGKKVNGPFSSRR